MAPRTFPIDENGSTFTRLPDQHREVAFCLHLALMKWKMPALKRRFSEEELKVMGKLLADRFNLCGWEIWYNHRPDHTAGGGPYSAKPPSATD